MIWPRLLILASSFDDFIGDSRGESALTQADDRDIATTLQCGNVKETSLKRFLREASLILSTVL